MVFANWYVISYLQWGFIGAPIARVIGSWLMLSLLLIYIASKENQRPVLSKALFLFLFFFAPIFVNGFMVNLHFSLLFCLFSQLLWGNLREMGPVSFPWHSRNHPALCRILGL